MAGQALLGNRTTFIGGNCLVGKCQGTVRLSHKSDPLFLQNLQRMIWLVQNNKLIPNKEYTNPAPAQAAREIISSTSRNGYGLKRVRRGGARC